MKTLNINDSVWVKLTPFGMEKLRKDYEEKRRKNPSEQITLPAVDKDGFCKMQLWVVMHTFGEYMYNGSTKACIETDIRIDDSQSKKSKE